MKAELISIGSELTSGRSLDTNTQWLSVELDQLGIPVLLHSTVSDDMDMNVDLLNAARNRCDLVILTGGLGPTQDDLTREAMALTAGVSLVEDKASLKMITEMFASRNREMPVRNKVQALFPVGSQPIVNHWGTAPGIWMTLDGDGGPCTYVALPGVPSEMKQIFINNVIPMLRESFSLGRVTVHRKINTFGSGESHIEEKLLDVTARGRTPEVGITASDATISLRITAQGPTEDAASQVIEPTVSLIRERLGELVFGEDDEDLHDVVAPLMVHSGMTLSVAEGCTGGTIAHRLTKMAGASQWFEGSITAYSTDLKKALLKVPGTLIERHGVVSDEVASAMARGCRIVCGTDIAVATVGVAGPEGGTDETPIGTVVTAIADSETVTVAHAAHIGSRDDIQSRASKHALNKLRLWLLSHL